MKTITVKTTVKAPITIVWKYWTHPEDIKHWNNASEDWHTPFVDNNLHQGGKFNYRMEAKDGSSGFNFAGVYNTVILHKQIDYTMDDGRKASNIFSEDHNHVNIAVTFDAENENSLEQQQNGWQAILNSFKTYVEKNQHVSNRQSLKVDSHVTSKHS